MSFQAYINNIKEKIGVGAEEWRRLADAKGFTQKGILKPSVKAGEVVAWIKNDYDLGHGHAMAIYALLKGVKTESDK